ncbi:MarR family transcriptional regulator [Rodentibacter caecimuris]|uniref:MarR family transcriptional regulator n=1 Tax=Rodentibacter caecimuris TaxID=1796644 RepID=UPI001EFA336B
MISECVTGLGKQQAEPICQATITLFEQVFNVFGEQNTDLLFTLIDEFNQILRTEIEK